MHMPGCHSDLGYTVWLGANDTASALTVGRRMHRDASGRSRRAGERNAATMGPCMPSGRSKE